MHFVFRVVIVERGTLTQFLWILPGWGWGMVNARYPHAYQGRGTGL